VTPRRVQMRRKKGWRMPEGAVYVGRPTRWGNPFMIGSNQPSLFVHDGRRVFWDTPRCDEALTSARAKAVELFTLHTGPMGRYELDLAEVQRHLAGKDLACWCPLDQPCHADVLLEMANVPEPAA
jgi:hypothetical protein